MSQLKSRSPQMFALINQANKNNANPMDLFKQVTNNYTPEQMSSLFERAKQFGVPTEVIQQVQEELGKK